MRLVKKSKKKKKLLSIFVCKTVPMNIFCGVPPHGIVANMLDCNIVMSEFELELHYYVPFLERYEPPYFPWNHYCFHIKIILALSNPWKLICHSTKKNKPTKLRVVIKTVNRIKILQMWNSQPLGLR